jgi:hypothetical protein
LKAENYVIFLKRPVFTYLHYDKLAVIDLKQYLFDRLVVRFLNSPESNCELLAKHIMVLITALLGRRSII